MKKSNIIVTSENEFTKPPTTEITVGQAREMHGADAHIHWRPDGILNMKDPDSDVAILIS